MCAAERKDLPAGSGTIVVAAHAWYDDVIGGSFRLASEFAQFLAETGSHVAYVCCAQDRTCKTTTRQAERGVEVWRYPFPRGPFGLHRALSHVRATIAAVRAVRAERRIVALSGHSPLQFLGAAMALRGTKTFANVTVHSPFDDELLANAGERPAFSRRAAGWVARKIDRRNIILADRVQTDSHFLLRALAQKHGDALGRKGVIAPGWVDLEQFRPARDRQRVRAGLGNRWSGSLRIFFTLRRLEPRMGLETLIDAAHILRQRGAEFRVLIGGGGSLQKRLEALIQVRGLTEHVRLLGVLPEEKLPLYYAAADCFVLPTRALECFGLIVLEAFACGTPVIASQVGAIPELVSAQGQDWLFTTGDAGQLAERMQRFLSGDLQPTIDLRTIAAQYDKPRILARWESLLNRDALPDEPGHPDAVGAEPTPPPASPQPVHR